MKGKLSSKKILLLSPFIINHDFKIYDMSFNPRFDSLSFTDIEGNITFYRNNKTNEENQLKKIKTVNPTNHSIMSISYSNDGQGTIN